MGAFYTYRRGLLSAIVTLLWLLQYLADSNALQQIVFWLFGSLLKASWTSVQVCGAVLALCLPPLAPSGPSMR